MDDFISSEKLSGGTDIAHIRSHGECRVTPISVVMPVYNTCPSILKEAVDSILNQSFRDFEFIIIDDGSTDDTRNYLNNLMDERIWIIWNRRNLGITKSLNIGLRAARGTYIARMDSDDISIPDRLEKQYVYMESHPDVILSGSKVEVFGDGHGISGGNRRRENMEDYRIELLFSNPGPYHSTAFIRREVFLKNHIQYDEKLFYAQDYGLYAVIAWLGRIVILDDVLLKYRIHRGQICRAHRKSQILCDKMTQKKQLAVLLDSVTNEEMDFHYKYSTGYYPEVVISPEAVAWYRRLIRANDSRQVYNRIKFRRYIGRLERRLVEQSFSREMSRAEKLRLSFRYLPLPSIIRVIAKMFLLRVYD